MNEKDFGLYRDDGLETLRNTSGPKMQEHYQDI